MKQKTTKFNQLIFIGNKSIIKCEQKTAESVA